MAEADLSTLFVLSEIIDSDDENFAREGCFDI